MVFTSKNIKSLLCVFTLLTVPVNNILAMELECGGKIDKKETNHIEDIEFTARFTNEVGRYSDGVLLSESLPVDGGEESIKFKQDMIWKYAVHDEEISFFYVTKDKINHYMFIFDIINGTFLYDEYNKNYGYSLYARGKGNCVNISD